MYDCLAFPRCTLLHGYMLASLPTHSHCFRVSFVCVTGWLVRRFDSGCLMLIWFGAFSTHDSPLFIFVPSVLFVWLSFVCEMQQSYFEWLIGIRMSVGRWYVGKFREMIARTEKCLNIRHNHAAMGCLPFTLSHWNECAQMSRDITEKLNERQIESVVESVGFRIKVDEIGTKRSI